MDFTSLTPTVVAPQKTESRISPVPRHEPSVETGPHPHLKPANDIQGAIRSLSRSYQVASGKHLLRSPDSQSKPKTARRLRNRTVKLEVGLPGLAKIHQGSLDSVKKEGLSALANKEQTQRSTAFFYSVVAPTEESRSTTSKTNIRLKESIKTLTRCTEDLTRSDKILLGEIAHRNKVEKSLRKSEHSSGLLLTQAREMQEEMRSLSRRTLTAQENERKRISRELHDVIAQTLAGINVRLAVLRSQSAASAEDFHKKIEFTERLVEQSVETVDRFASDLRPVVLDDIGLIPALKTVIDSFTTHYGIPVKMTASPGVEELDVSSLTTIFRISQEALTDIGRHSNASLVKLDLRSTETSFRLKIGDNGHGLASKGKSPASETQRLGILGMRERAEMIGGSFLIRSAPGNGTLIRVDLPRTATTPVKVPPARRSSPRNPKKNL